jgi:hypothetical protein
MSPHVLQTETEGVILKMFIKIRRILGMYIYRKAQKITPREKIVRRIYASLKKNLYLYTYFLSFSNCMTF